MAKRLDKFQLLECENSDCLKTVVRASDGSISLQNYPYPLTKNGQKIAVGNLGATWNKEQHRSRMTCVCPLGNNLQTPATILTRRMTENLPPTSTEQSPTCNYAIVDVTCGRPFTNTDRCNFRLSVNDILRHAGDELYSQPLTHFAWMDEISSQSLAVTLEKNAKDHATRRNQKTQGGLPISDVHGNSYGANHHPSSSTRPQKSPAFSYPSGSGSNRAHKAPNPYPLLKPATSPSSSPLSSNAPSSTFIYDDAEYDETKQQGEFDCSVCGRRGLPLADLHLHEDYKCTAVQQGRSLSSDVPRRSIQPGGQGLGVRARTQSVPRPPGTSLTSAPTTSPPLPLPLTDLEIHNLHEIKKACIPSRHLFKCPYCEKWVAIEHWILHKGGSCVSDTESDSNVPAVQAACYRTDNM